MKNLRQSIALVLLSITLVGCFYENNPDIVTLTSSNFDSLVTNSNGPWFIQFYGKSLINIFSKLVSLVP
jgi:hypothetical protein